MPIISAAHPSQLSIASIDRKKITIPLDNITFYVIVYEHMVIYYNSSLEDVGNEA